MGDNLHYPHALDAERAVIGAILLDPAAVDAASNILRPEDFYRDAHRVIFESIQALASRSVPVDLVTLTDHLRSRGELDRAGGTAALAEAIHDTGTSANIQGHAQLIVDKARMRRLMDATERIRQSIKSGAGGAEEILDSAEREIFQVASTRTSREPRLISSLLSDAFDRIDQVAALKGGFTGIETGYADLDRMTSGLQKSDLIILAGRPSMGKTALAINLMEGVMAHTHKPIVFFSLEMSAEAVTMRFLASASRVSFKKIRTGRLNEHEWAELAKAADRLQKSKLYIDDTSSLTPTEIRSRCRRIAAQVGEIGLIAVDYLQLMNAGRKIDNRVQEVSEISRTLKGVARELQTPMLVLSQLSRAPTQRADHRPQLSDLRDSGAIEQDADIVAFVHREDYAGEGGGGISGEAELLIRKHRNGETGPVKLIFIHELMRFESAARVDDYERDTAVIG